MPNLQRVTRRKEKMCGLGVSRFGCRAFLVARNRTWGNRHLLQRRDMVGSKGRIGVGGVSDHPWTDREGNLIYLSTWAANRIMVVSQAGNLGLP